MKKFKVTFITGNNKIEAVYVRTTTILNVSMPGFMTLLVIWLWCLVSSVVKVEPCLDVAENKIMDQTGDVAES